MIIRVLMDNAALSNELAKEHGLSLYIETATQRILFDTGASSAFARNAQKMGVDLAEADLAVLSHGHYDHGGGLEEFLRLNQTAPVYVQEGAFAGYFAQEEEKYHYIGLAQNLRDSSRFRRLTGNSSLTPDSWILSGIRPLRLNPPDNRTMYHEEAGGMMPDRFDHEQNLILKEEGKTLLVTGCAHKGIVNILEQFYMLKGAYPDAVLGGFHLPGDAMDHTLEGIVREIGSYLKDTGADFFTGHCTGNAAFSLLREILGSRLEGIAAGRVLRLFGDAVD